MVDERQLEREVHKETPLFPLRCVVFSGRRKRRPFFSLSLSRCAVGAALGARGGGRRASFSMCARELSRVPMRCVCKQSE